MSNDNLISVEHLYRRYAGLVAVKDVSFELQRGEVLGFLGPNGAGKTTTMQIITGNLAPTSGRILINGLDLLDRPRQAKGEIGYLPEQPPLYRELTVDEYLRFCARLNRLRRDTITAAVDRAKQRCGLEQVGRRLINNLSKGYQQRVGIAQAIIHSPAVVVLDEPTVGLDPIQIREIRELIRELGEEHGVILSTHILPEVQMTCDRVQIINRGQLVFSDHVDNLDRRMQSSSLILGLQQPPAQHILEALPGINDVQALDNHRFRLLHAAETNPAGAIAQQAVEQGWGLFELTPEHKTLEQIFVEITSSEQSDTEIEAA
ncbi:ABC transporter ATP-binding protein [Thiohalophilus thiocyanatoxydans]|uniref:ABC-2 type transport system ATP-binding protein n=1 Tax=Thiohalophilus thiocyanatoxydans TaxID=381308 RepID=A0A4R8ISV0_9GAMM|nr:ABC transporter ATP-binding protein [Thiohalophilus thiocyanatoxydans]TDY04122.1 ABC-2 type transport system ATP-binding protein [Thiohalophilus thiocyanatoxydans]